MVGLIKLAMLPYHKWLKMIHRTIKLNYLCFKVNISIIRSKKIVHFKGLQIIGITFLLRSSIKKILLLRTLLYIIIRKINTINRRNVLNSNRIQINQYKNSISKTQLQ
jgi:hypothetical protein